MARPSARRMFELVEPIAVVTYLAQEPTEAVMALGLPKMWDAYMAGRAAPFGKDAPAAVVDAAFYNFGPGEVARHIPKVWEKVTPEAAHEARTGGSAAALRRILGDLADTPAVGRAGELLLKAGTSGRVEGRALYAAFSAMPIPTDPVARLWHGANLLREHRGDGHSAALLSCGVDRTECHVLLALDMQMRPEDFGRIWHLPKPMLAGVVEGLKQRGVIGDDGWFTDEGRALKARVEALTDDLAAPAYDVLTDDELGQLVADLEPLAEVLVASGSE